MRHTYIMRRALSLSVGMLMIAVAVRAQTPAAAVPDRGYVQAVADSAFGNVTSQSFGAEVGVTVRPDLQVFGAFGNIRDVATAELGAAAQTIAGALSQLQPGTVTYSVKEPVTFFVGGVRYRIATSSKVKPYVAAGAGVGMVSKDVKFLINGSEATSTLSQLVTLGSDVSGDESKLMITVGGGVVYPVWRQLFVDLHYHFAHISTQTSITVNRVGLGLGISF
jgi:opacity protein-like surface antigen